MSKLSTPSHSDRPTFDLELLADAVEELTGLAAPTLGELHAHAVSRGTRASTLLAEAERIAAERDLRRRHLDWEIRALRTVQDVGRYADQKGLDVGAVFTRRMRMGQAAS